MRRDLELDRPRILEDTLPAFDQRATVADVRAAPSLRPSEAWLTSGFGAGNGTAAAALAV